MCYSSLLTTEGRPAEFNVEITGFGEVRDIGPDKIYARPVELTVLECVAFLMQKDWNGTRKAYQCPMNYGPTKIKFRPNEPGSASPLLTKHIIWALEPIWDWATRHGWQNIDFKLRIGNILLATGSIRSPRKAIIGISNHSSQNATGEDGSADPGSSFDPNSTSSADESTTTIMGDASMSLGAIPIPNLAVSIRSNRPAAGRYMPPSQFNYLLLEEVIIMAQRGGNSLFQGFTKFEDFFQYTMSLTPGDFSDAAKVLNNTVAAFLVPQLVVRMFALDPSGCRGILGEGTQGGEKVMDIKFYSGRAPSPGETSEQVTQISR